MVEVIGQVDFGDYDDASVELALAIANTRPTDLFPEELPDEASLAALLDRHEFPVPSAGVTASDLTEIHALRAELVAALEATDVADAARVLNVIMARSGVRPRLTDHDGRWHLHYETDDDRLAARLGAMCAPSLALLVRDAGVGRFGACEDGACESFFVDASRNAARRFCCHTCATRTSVAAYRKRKREATAT